MSKILNCLRLSDSSQRKIQIKDKKAIELNIFILLLTLKSQKKKKHLGTGALIQHQQQYHQH